MTSSSMERVLTTLGHREPDRVPLFLLLTLHGAKELGLSIQQYFSKASSVVEGQLRLQKKYQNDCLYSFFYASIETEAFGGETIYIEDGPPNAGEPIIRNPEDILKLQPPRIAESLPLKKVLETQHELKQKVGGDIPIIGVVMSPFSLPVMQMGFEAYLNLLYERPDLFWKLMEINEAFCISWANAQLDAGATAICYFDPISSSTMITRDQYLSWGWPVAKKTISQIKGPTATHFASGRCLPILEDVISTGTLIAGVSMEEDLSTIKENVGERLTILGNLNGIEMRRWNSTEAETAVKTCISAAGQGGGYILSDNHGEIPYQVSDETLMAISDAAHQWGRYPLTWLQGPGSS